MKLVDIVLDYPYHIGEEFCRQELEIAQNFFEDVYLISLSGHVNEKKKRYLPEKIKLIHARKKRYELGIALKSFFLIWNIKTIKEIYFAKRKLKVKESIKEIISFIFIYYYYCNLLDRVFKNEKFGRDCIFYSYWMSAPAYFLSKLKNGFFTISRTHRVDCFIRKCYQPFRREILENLDCIVSISDAGKNDILKNLAPFTKMNVRKLFVSRLGIMKWNIDNNSIKKKTSILHIVSCSNINKIKRLDLIIDALNILDIELKWTHIGDGEFGNQIREYAKKLSLKRNIICEWKGWMSQEDIYQYYNQNHIDLFINCSDSEGIPVSIMEIMSYGVPVIARNVGGNSEIVNEYNGYLLDGKNIAKKLSDAIIEYVQLPDKDKIEKRKNAFLTYDNKYRADKNYVQFFNNIIKRANKKFIKSKNHNRNICYNDRNGVIK